jgi:hypothetical protein
MCRGTSAVQSYHMITVQNHLLRSKSSNYFACTCTQSLPLTKQHEPITWSKNVYQPKTKHNHLSLYLCIPLCLLVVLLLHSYHKQIIEERRKQKRPKMSTYEHEFLNIEVPASSNIFVQFISLFMTKFIFVLSEIYLLIYNFLVQTFVLKVHMNCQGCRIKVKKVLRKIEGNV